MPDHWHGLVQLDAQATSASVVQRLKGTSARRLRAQYPEIGPTWAPGYHDHALRMEEDLLTAARYVVLNPLRAGLVDSIRDYPYWDAMWVKARG